MRHASWNGAVIAASEHCELVEGNQYFPAAAVKREFDRNMAPLLGNVDATVSGLR